MTKYTIKKYGSGFKVYKGRVAMTTTVTKQVAQDQIKAWLKREKWENDPKTQAKAAKASHKRVKSLIPWYK